MPVLRPDLSDLTALTETELRGALEHALRQVYAYAHYDHMTDEDRADQGRNERNAARIREELAARGLEP
jgi:hypothetical protein